MQAPALSRHDRPDAAAGRGLLLIASARTIAVPNARRGSWRLCSPRAEATTRGADRAPPPSQPRSRSLSNPRAQRELARSLVRLVGADAGVRAGQSATFAGPFAVVTPTRFCRLSAANCCHDGSQRAPVVQAPISYRTTKPPQNGGFIMRRRGLEPPRGNPPTRPSTLRVYQFRHRRRGGAQYRRLIPSDGRASLCEQMFASSTSPPRAKEPARWT